MRGSLPRLMKFCEDHADERETFEILAIHDTRCTNFEELDEKLASIRESSWGGRELPFPVLLDATGETVKRFGIRGFPTHVLIDPEGKVVKGGSEKLLEARVEGAPEAETDGQER